MSAQPISRPLDISNLRYWQQNARMAVRDVYDAIVELVTNADDAYERSDIKQGSIEIEVERRRNGAPSMLRVRDFAGGMSHAAMEAKLSRLGDRTHSGLAAGQSVRGTNSRGAKDVASLGSVVFESVDEDGQFNRCKITARGRFEMDAPVPATVLTRAEIGIAERTGTLVTVEVDPTYSIPQHSTLLSRIRSLVPLRDILSDPDREVLVRDLAQDRKDHVRYVPPEGTERVKEQLQIPGYPTVQAKLTIKRSKRPFENRTGAKFRDGGILVKSRRAIHESTLFAPEFEHDPLAAYFFGRLRCEYIDDLWNEADHRLEKDLPPDPKNPFPILDPSRQAGLRRDHPFFEALQKEVLRRLRPLIEEERRREASELAQIENRETRKKLNELERLATKFMSQNQEDADDDLDNPVNDNLPKGTVDYALSPPFVQMIAGQHRQFALTVNVDKHPELAVGTMVQVQCETADVSASAVYCPLEPHPGISNMLRAVWDVRAVSPTSATGIVVRVGSIVATSAIEVLQSEKDLYVEVKDLQFWRQRYRLKVGVKKRVRVVAPYPAVILTPLVLDVSCDNPNLLISGDRTFQIKPELGIADCRFYVTATAPEFNATLKARVVGREATAEVVVAPPEGDGIRIEIKDVDYKNQRSRWEKGTNTLIIAARHPSIRRYLGSPAAGFPGQDRTQFQVLLAEIVAFAVCEKILSRNVQQNPDEFREADFDMFMAARDELVSRFLPLAHESQVPKPF